MTSRFFNHARSGFLLFCLVLLALNGFVTLRPGGLAQQQVVLLLGVAVRALAVASLWWAYRTSRAAAPALAPFWGLVMLAVACTGLGDLLWLLSAKGAAHAAYVAQYPLMLAAVLRLPAQGSRRESWWKATLDLLIIVAAVGLACWDVLIEPVWLASSGQALWMRLLGMFYPLGDLLLVWVIWESIYRLGEKGLGAPLGLLAGAIFSTIAADSLDVLQGLRGPSADGSAMHLLYALSMLLFSLAGLAQSWHLRRAPAPARAPAAAWLAYLPYLWVAGAFVWTAARIDVVSTQHLHALIASFGLIVTAVVLRQVLALAENRQLYRALHQTHAQVQQQASALQHANLELQAEILVRQRAEQQLSHEALHDGLTGLPNRVLLLDRLQQAAKKNLRQVGYRCAVLFVDLDGFKTINDSLGHESGDRLLQIVAARLVETVRATDTVARLGGDEFVLLLEDDGEADAAAAAGRILTALHRPLLLDEKMLYLSASIGVVPRAEQYQAATDALRDADLAMYQAKSNGKACYAVYDEKMREQMMARMVLENDLRRALEKDEFLLVYQPIFALGDHRLVGFEALVRWQHPQRGLVEPAQFIPLAEETGLIIPLGRWVLNEACRQAVQWRRLLAEGSHPLRISVNVSGRQLEQPGFVDEVRQALHESGLPGSCLALEVTESVCLQNTPALIAQLEALKALGIEMQIDDFGTGYSSLSYLHMLPVQIIKIDKSFVQAIQGGERSPEILRAILSIAGQLGIETVAEGIETERQARVLADLHCGYAQGFWLGRPVEASQATGWVSGAQLTLPGWGIQPLHASGAASAD